MRYLGVALFLVAGCSPPPASSGDAGPPDSADAAYYTPRCEGNVEVCENPEHLAFCVRTGHPHPSFEFRRATDISPAYCRPTGGYARCEDGVLTCASGMHPQPLCHVDAVVDPVGERCLPFL